MRRPEWAAAGTFPAAWEGASLLAQWTALTGSDLESNRRPIHSVLAGLSKCHVVRFDPAQMDVLPEATDVEINDVVRHGRGPFDLTYLSLGEAMGAVVLADNVGDDAGLVLWAFRLVKVPAAGRDRARDWLYPVMQARAADDVVVCAPVHKPFHEAMGALVDGWQEFCSQAIRYTATALYFLQSANVELVDGPASRQERRHVERKGGRIALTVQIRAPKKRPRSDAPVEHPDWSHRWEVRGHYKHFPVGTKLADSRPDKLVDHGTLGQCRRIWCPPHVKGPQDKPLVPKLRVVADALAG